MGIHKMNTQIARLTYLQRVHRSRRTSIYRYISLTESGENTLEAFQYLWRDDSPLLSEQL